MCIAISTSIQSERANIFCDGSLKVCMRLCVCG